MDYKNWTPPQAPWQVKIIDGQPQIADEETEGQRISRQAGEEHEAFWEAHNAARDAVADGEMDEQ
jgi:hypothetical protein